MKTLRNSLKIVCLCICCQSFAQSDGRLDSTFGVGGKILIPLSSSVNLSDVNVSKALLQQDGGVVALVSKSFLVEGVYVDTTVLCHLLPNGQLDLSFGVGGFLPVGMRAYNMLSAESGRFWVIGNDDDNEVIIQKYETSGLLDISFGVMGKVYTGLFMYVSDVKKQPDGKIVMIGGADKGSMLVRLNANGSRDMLFGTDGYKQVQFDAANLNEYVSDIMLLSDGGMFIAGVGYINQYKAALLKLTANGDRDSSFSEDGHNSYPFFTYDIVDMLITPDGKILLGSTNINSNGIILYRIKPNGNADSTFGFNGQKGLTFATGTNSLSKLVQHPDGKVICIGSSNNQFALLRVDHTGTLDNTFNGTGKSLTSFGNGFTSYAQDAVVFSDGKLGLIGSGFGNDNTLNISMARYISGIHVGLIEESEIGDVVVYPNPVLDELYIRYSLPEQTAVSIAIYDIQGRLVNQAFAHQEQDAGEHQEKIVPHLKSGFYVVQITAGNSKKLIKILKM